MARLLKARPPGKAASPSRLSKCGRIQAASSGAAKPQWKYVKDFDVALIRRGMSQPISVLRRSGRSGIVQIPTGPQADPTLGFGVVFTANVRYREIKAPRQFSTDPVPGGETRAPR
jgi:hypothetical protein